MGRPRKIPIAQDIADDLRPAKKEKTTVSVIYKPTDRFDPAWVEWNGIRFGANLAVELDPANPAHYVEQLLPLVRVMPDGERLTTHRPERMFMGELARGNYQFEVDGEQIKHMISTRVVPQPGEDWAEHHKGQLMEAAFADDMTGQISGIPTSRRS